jgi:dipeptidyl aminopeptidase/acylaminoacyl peptidase
MRRQTYPGIEITVEQTLEPGTNYDRYLASYLSEGYKIYALLTVPRDRRADGWPVIVFNHGYIPPPQYRTTERYVAYVDALARNGYIVLRPDYRGHGNSEGDAASNYASPAYTIDVLNAVASIQRFPGADPDRIGMWGHSMGGGITLRIMVTTSDVKAGVIWAGTVASYAELFERRWAGGGGGDSPLPPINPDGGRWQWLPEMLAAHGTPAENPAFYASISPNTYLADLSGPIQLHHGTADTSVPVEYSEMLAAQARAAGKPLELFTYPGDNHNISANFGRAMARSIRFFDRYVKEADASPP